MSNLLEGQLEQGLQVVLETARRRLVDNLRSLIDQFTAEDKLEGAFVFLLSSLGLNPMMLNPFCWATSMASNTLEDLRSAAPQGRASIASKILYDSKTSDANILSFLRDSQDKITRAMQ
mmetsp:Transcript_38596/g.50592  ORF Transcript_38596/g.50592 Transcript_38596/m.50592 type:complete len:119 (-) Transcript_38596:280-636(-)